MVSKKTRTAAPEVAVRVLKAYFDCRFGQLHVRTAFPGSGGFDERTTLLCLHPAAATSRYFTPLLPLLATDRSIYAPDLPGSGESDSPAALDAHAQAEALGDFLETMRLRQIDLLSCADSASVAAALIHTRAALIRKHLSLLPNDSQLLLSEPEILGRRIRDYLDRR